MIKRILFLLLIFSIPPKKASADAWKFHPYGGLAAGVWTGEGIITTSGVGGVQGGLYGPSIGLSLYALYYSGRTQLMPLMVNAFFRVPMRDPTQDDLLTLRIGGGASYFLLEPSELSNIGSQANLGLDFWLTEKVALALDAFYFFFNPAAGYAGSAPAHSVLSLLSVKYRFR